MSNIEKFKRLCKPAEIIARRKSDGEVIGMSEFFYAGILNYDSGGCFVIIGGTKKRRVILKRFARMVWCSLIGFIKPKTIRP